jgi:hypothetical protein
MSHRLLIVLTSMLLGSGCAPRSEPGQPLSEPTPATEPVVRQFVGIYEAGWELEVFRPCGIAEEWWSWSTMRIITDDPRGWGRRLVVVEGGVSVLGRYGHLGRYPRQIVITRLIEVLGDADAACPPGRDGPRAGASMDSQDTMAVTMADRRMRLGGGRGA